MKDVKIYIIIGLAIALVLSFVFRGCGKNQDIKQALNQHRHDSLSGEIRKKRDSIAVYSTRVSQQQSKIDSLIKLIVRNENAIDTLWIGFAVRDSFINTFPVTQLERRLAERFGK